jgi:hypothetical protein
MMLPDFFFYYRYNTYSYNLLFLVVKNFEPPVPPGKYDCSLTYLIFAILYASFFS